MNISNKSSRNILLEPGPITLTDRVRTTLLLPDICHREIEFAELLHEKE